MRPKRLFPSLLSLAAALAVAQPGRLGAQNPPGSGTVVASDPRIPTCPVGNCPTRPGAGFGGNGGGPTLSSHWVHGRTAADRTVSEFLSNTGLYIGTGAGRGQKVASYIGAMQGRGAGSGWTLNTDIVRGACPGGPNSLYGMPGSGIPFGEGGCNAAPGSLGAESTIGYELDLSNFDADSMARGAFIVGLYVNTLSRYTSGSGISFGNAAGQDGARTRPSWHHGIEFAPNTVADATVYDLSNSPFSLYTAGAHGLATIKDESTGPLGIHMAGTKGQADLQSDSRSPISINIRGAHASAGLNDASTGGAALTLSGTYAVAAISTQDATTQAALVARPGQLVCFAGGNGACVGYDPATRKLTYSQGGVRLFSVDDRGNAVFRGSVVGNGTP